VTRRMADSITPSALPNVDLYAGYDDGRYLDVPAIKALKPGKTVMAVTVRSSDNEGDCIDVENGDATPAQAPGWTRMRRAAGHGGPLTYCSWAALPGVIAQYKAQGVALPGFWVAGYPSPDGDAIPTYPGATIVGHQWIDHGGWDESIMVDYLPGIDPAPTPPPPPPPSPPPTQEETMYVAQVTGQEVVYQVWSNGTKTPLPNTAAEFIALIASKQEAPYEYPDAQFLNSLPTNVA
jgi:hypothetical protein